VKNTLNRRHETKYNITANDYDTMLKEQNHKCKICLISFLHTKHSTKPFIDHCHTTNKVRGLLCLHCNAGLGYFKDDVDVDFYKQTDDYAGYVINNLKYLIRKFNERAY
jgi:hypothetical protein